MKKKLILSITTILLIINALLPNYMCKTFAGNQVTANQTTQNQTNQNATLDNYNKTASESHKQDAFNVLETPTTINQDKDGTIVGLGKWFLGEASDMASMAIKVLIKMFCAIPYSLQFVMMMVATPENESYVQGNPTANATYKNWIDDSKINWFTIQNTVFGKVPLFNVDFFDVNTNGSEPNSKLKSSVASWYQTSFIIAQAVSIAVLIYIGIRMALASNPEQKVNYKKMFKNWIVGFAILFLLKYGIVFILKLSNWILTLIPESISGKNFEKEIIEKSINIFDDKESAWTVLIYALTYVIIVGYEIYFFIKYFKRLLTMGFLIMIAPLITVTYAIDKAGDGKAQAFEAWKRMFISNAFMQPVHAFVYMIFIYSASSIATKAPMIAIVFFMGILKAEDIFNKLFKLEKTD